MLLILALTWCPQKIKLKLLKKRQAVDKIKLIVEENSRQKHGLNYFEAFIGYSRAKFNMSLSKIHIN